MQRAGFDYVNFIPYIPVNDDRCMDISWSHIIMFLEEVNKVFPGYLEHYVADFNDNQNKILYEYHKDKGFEECTAEYNACGHNKNFSKVISDGTCYICALKQYLNERAV